MEKYIWDMVKFFDKDIINTSIIIDRIDSIFPEAPVIAEFVKNNPFNITELMVNKLILLIVFIWPIDVCLNYLCSLGSFK